MPFRREQQKMLWPLTSERCAVNMIAYMRFSFCTVGQGVGYAVVLGFGVAFSVITTMIVYINRWFSDQGDVTSEHFK